VVVAVNHLKVRSYLLEGEVVRCDEKGVTSFQLLRHRRNESRAFLFAIDLLSWMALICGESQSRPVRPRWRTPCARAGVLASTIRPPARATRPCPHARSRCTETAGSLGVCGRARAVAWRASCAPRNDDRSASSLAGHPCSDHRRSRVPARNREIRTPRVGRSHFGGGGSGSRSAVPTYPQPPHKWTTSPDSGRTGGSLRASRIASPHWGHRGADSGSFRTSIELGEHDGRCISRRAVSARAARQPNTAAPRAEKLGVMRSNTWSARLARQPPTDPEDFPRSTARGGAWTAVQVGDILARN
jgi:hypothetical protein